MSGLAFMIHLKMMIHFVYCIEGNLGVGFHDTLKLMIHFVYCIEGNLGVGFHDTFKADDTFCLVNRG